MAYETILGYEGSVSLGTNKILGQGTWTLSGINRAVLDASEFGDDWRKNRFGRIDPGQVQFNGFFIPDDPYTEDAIQALYSGANLTTLRFNFDNGATSGFFAPNSSTTAHGYLAANSPIGYINIVNISITNDQNDLTRVQFTGQISGALARYNADGSYWYGV